MNLQLRSVYRISAGIVSFNFSVEVEVCRLQSVRLIIILLEDIIVMPSVSPRMCFYRLNSYIPLGKIRNVFLPG